VADPSLAHIEHLSALKVLELTATGTTDEGLQYLKGLTSLQGLGLSHCHVTGTGIKLLENLKDLRELWLSGADLDDTELESVTIFTKLVQLGLSGTKITNHGLESLAKLKELVRLYAFNTGVDKDGAQKLRQSLPNCRAKWKPAQPYIPEDSQSSDTEYGDDLNSLPESLLGMLESPQPPANKVAENGKGNDLEFWRCIEMLDWEKCGDDDSVIEPAVEWLSKKSEREITAFANTLSEKLHRLDGETFAKEIGKDAYKGPHERFARNWFLRVRCCVVANGSDYYKEVLAHPQAMPKDLEFEAVLRIAPKAFERKTGRKMPHGTKYNYETFANKEGWSSR
jgi:hypothetical protein